MSRKDEVAQQIVELWSRTSSQIEDMAKSLKLGSVVDRLRSDHARLIAERDRLLRKLGEETYKLIEKKTIDAPKPLQELAKRLQTVAKKLLVRKAAGGGRNKSGKKTSAKPKGKKPGARKAAKRKTARGRKA